MYNSGAWGTIESESSFQWILGILTGEDLLEENVYYRPIVVAVTLALSFCSPKPSMAADAPTSMVSLNGTWWAVADADKSGETKAYQTVELARSEMGPGGWVEVTVPCTFDAIGPAMKKYHGTCWFRRSFKAPESWRGRRVVLHFDGVNNQAKVWINGRLVGESIDPFLPCDLRVEQALNHGGSNTIAVEVNNEHPHSGLPSFFGWRSEGGILRDIELRATNHLYIDNVKIDADHEGRFSVRTTVANHGTSEAEARLRIRLSDKSGKTLFETSKPAAVGRARQEAFHVRGKLDGVDPWSPETPSLYMASVELVENDNAVAAKRVRFGFRTIETRGHKVLLNGRPIYLFGFNRHEDSHLTGMAWDAETTESDLRDMKRMGANFVRLCHYPHSPKEIDRCDELGLLVMCEIPYYMCNLDRRGKQHRATERRLVEQSARRQMIAMVRRDWNHPAVVFWSTGNENNEADPEVREIHGILARLTKKLDPTRLVTHVSIQGNWNNPNFTSHDDDDVIGANAYGYMNYGDKAGEKFFEPAFAMVHKRYPNKPLFITEYGNWEIKRDPKPGWGARQATAIKHDVAYMRKPYICGSLIWAYADHCWPPDDPFLPDVNGVSPYGLYSRDRRRAAGVDAAEEIFQDLKGMNSSEHRQGGGDNAGEKE